MKATNNSNSATRMFSRKTFIWYTSYTTTSIRSFKQQQQKAKNTSDIRSKVLPTSLFAYLTPVRLQGMFDSDPVGSFPLTLKNEEFFQHFALSNFIAPIVNIKATLEPTKIEENKNISLLTNKRTNTQAQYDIPITISYFYYLLCASCNCIDYTADNTWWLYELL